MMNLIITLPSANKLDQIEHAYASGWVVGARYNTGIRTSYSPEEVVEKVGGIAAQHGKPLWLDLKGRQLRILKWADPTYGDIKLSRAIDVTLPARITFRGGDSSNIIAIDGPRIIVDPDPPHALGAGQAVNVRSCVLGQRLRVKGPYLTDSDVQFIEASRKAGLHNYMLSFFEEAGDLHEVRQLDPDAVCVLKIESPRGLQYVEHDWSCSSGQLMAARDDLTCNLDAHPRRVLDALRLIISKDSSAMVASHLFSSLESTTGLTSTDFTDVAYLQQLGYQNYMLSDGVSHHHLDAALALWSCFTEG